MDSSREGKEAGEQEQPESSAKASEPTVQEISDYAEYLGLRPGEDGELLWIAEQALLAPLPEGWKEIEDHKGNVLYFNSDSGKAQYAHPCDEEYKGFFQAFKAVISDLVSREEIVEMAKYLGIDIKTEQSLLWIARQCVIAPLPFDWEEKEDEGGKVFYENAKKGVTSREHPLDNIFRVLIVTERNKMNEKSLVRVGNTGNKPSIEMRLIRSDGSALYTYDWTSGKVSDIQPLKQAKEESKIESKASDLPRLLVEDLQKKGILEETSSKASSTTKPITTDESEPAMPPVQQSRLPLTSRKSGFPSIQRKQRAAKAMSQRRKKTLNALPLDNLFVLFGYINPLSWLLFLLHRIKMLLNRKK